MPKCIQNKATSMIRDMHMADTKENALKAYEKFIETFSTKYELAHLYIKEKNYKNAKPILEEILGLYTADFSNTLPPEYKKLAQIDFAKIPE